MARPCMFLGPPAGNIVIGCCGGTERTQTIHSCLHQDRLAQYASESIAATGIANVDIAGQRQPQKVVSCQSCELKLVSINPMPIPIVAAVKPVSRLQQDIEDRRRRRLPSNPRQRAVVIDCNRYGIGDAVVAAWIAEGAKRDSSTSPQIVLCANGERKQLLEILGQTINYPHAPTVNVAFYAEYLNSAMGQGSPPFALARARSLGITSDPIRPPVVIPEELKQWSSQDEWQSDVLLFPQAFQRSRSWQDQHWINLYELLQARGLKTRVVGLNPSPLQKLTAWTTGLSLMQITSLINNTKLVIGNDSGPMHIAGTLDKTAIAVFGRTTDAVFSHTPSVRCIHAERRIVPCAGCWSGWGYNPSLCESSCKALESITADRVFRLAMDLLAP